MFIYENRMLIQDESQVKKKSGTWIGFNNLNNNPVVHCWTAAVHFKLHTLTFQA